MNLFNGLFLFLYCIRKRYFLFFLLKKRYFLSYFLRFHSALNLSDSYRNKLSGDFRMHMLCAYLHFVTKKVTIYDINLKSSLSLIYLKKRNDAKKKTFVTSSIKKSWNLSDFQHLILNVLLLMIIKNEMMLIYFSWICIRLCWRLSKQVSLQTEIL